eukprot:scaffold7075_cov274-Pinguiococcus_pyrenoidosus.AAC.18
MVLDSSIFSQLPLVHQDCFSRESLRGRPMTHTWLLAAAVRRRRTADRHLQSVSLSRPPNARHRPSIAPFRSERTLPCLALHRQLLARSQTLSWAQSAAEACVARISRRDSVARMRDKGLCARLPKRLGPIAVLLLLLATHTHAYIGRAARFLRNRFQKRLVEPKAESPIDSEVRMVPLVPPEDGLLPIPPAQMPHVADPAAFLPLQSPELQPVGKPSAFDPLMQLYDDIVEGFKASLKNKELSRRYPRDVFLSSSHLRNCRPLSSCPIASEGDFDVVGFMEVDNRPFLRAVEAAGLGGKLDKPPENKRISTRSGSSSSSGIFSFKRDEQPSLQRLPVTRLRCGGEY